MAAGQAEGTRRGVFEVDEDAALAALEKAWASGGYHAVGGVRPAAVLRVAARGRYDRGAAGPAQPAGAAAGHAAHSGQGRPVTAGFDPAGRVGLA
jgi:hypothetical protein